MAAPANVQATITAAAAQYGVPASLALAVAQQESGFNQNAVSSAGAIGIFQLMPATAAQLGVNPYDVTQNIQGGVRYLGMLLSEFGDPTAAVAAYDWGPGNVSKAISSLGPNWLASAPTETQNYVDSILGVTPSSYQQVAQTPSAVPVEMTDADSTDASDAGGDESIDFEYYAPAIPVSSALPWVALLGAGLVVWGISARA